MHHAVLDRWSRQSSPLHARDARVKLLALFGFLAALATAPPSAHTAVAAAAGLLAAAILAGRLPFAGMLWRAALVLPFSAVFALVSWLSGDAPRALALIEKSYLSALAVLLLAATTPLAELLRGAGALGVPPFLVMVVQFLYRYLFVISEQAQHMRLAAQCRGFGARRPEGFGAAAGALAVLFARSYARAAAIHNAMLARGFDGHIRQLAPRRARPADAAFLLAAWTLCAAGRWYLA